MDIHVFITRKKLQQKVPFVYKAILNNERQETKQANHFYVKKLNN